MCGIFGGLGLTDPLAALQTMGRVLKHRGPDDDGFFIDGPVALGHTRLSIIDLSTGSQPMSSADGQYVIVFNGEIYNFQDIRTDLLKKGHLFRTLSDTEVILNAYREWGMDCVNRFNGMFAFALWDKGLRRLWLVRDRLGKKPLYLLCAGGALYFASEAKALWSLPDFHGTSDVHAVDQYLTFRYVPGERTFYKEIKKLPAGYWLLVDDKAKVLQRKHWWKVPESRERMATRSVQSYREEFYQLFSSAVKLRLISDVPLGAFLSSGIDSVSIASEMAKVSRPTFFTVGFGDGEDEVEAASCIASELGGQHHVLRMEEGDFDLLPKVVAAMDEPYGDPIVLPTYLLARKAAEHVKVVLTGDGADEILGGYIHHVFFRQMPLWPSLIRKGLAMLTRSLPVALMDRAFNYPASMGTAGRDRLASLIGSYPDGINSYLNFASLFSDTDKQDIYSKDFWHALADEPDELAEEMRAHFARTDIGMLDKAVQWDLKTWFPEQTLMKFDRLTMANSIEGRCPYADHRLVEFFLQLPLDLYKMLCDNKRIVRDEYQIKRPFLPGNKRPFYLPMHKGFDLRLQKFQNEVLGSGELRKVGWFNPEAVEKLRNGRARSPLLRDKQIMNLVVLLYWLRQKGNIG